MNSIQKSNGTANSRLVAAWAAGILAFGLVTLGFYELLHKLRGLPDQSFEMSNVIAMACGALFGVYAGECVYYRSMNPHGDRVRSIGLQEWLLGLAAAAVGLALLERFLYDNPGISRSEELVLRILMPSFVLLLLVWFGHRAEVRIRNAKIRDEVAAEVDRDFDEWEQASARLTRQDVGRMWSDLEGREFKLPTVKFRGDELLAESFHHFPQGWPVDELFAWFKRLGFERPHQTEDIRHSTERD